MTPAEPSTTLDNPPLLHGWWVVDGCGLAVAFGCCSFVRRHIHTDSSIAVDPRMLYISGARRFQAFCPWIVEWVPCAIGQAVLCGGLRLWMTGVCVASASLDDRRVRCIAAAGGAQFIIQSAIGCGSGAEAKAMSILGAVHGRGGEGGLHKTPPLFREVCLRTTSRPID